MGVIWNKVLYDIWRNKLRTLLVVISIAVGVFAIGTTFGMVEQMIPVMDSDHASTRPPHITLNLSTPIDQATINALKKTPGVVDINPAGQVEIRYKLRPEDEWSKGYILMRANWENQIFELMQLRQGDWPSGKALDVERMHAPYYGIEIGDQVIIQVDEQEKRFPVQGIIRAPFVPPPSMWDLTYFFSGEQVIERVKEIGIMRAVGARSPALVRMFLMEGLVQGMLSWLIAVPLAILVTPLLSGALGQTMFNTELTFRLNYNAMLIWLALVLSVSTLASIIPALNAARINVRQSLSYE